MSGETDRVRWRGVRPVEGIRGIWPARNSVRVYEDASQSGIGTSIIYTVPAGKLFFLATLSFGSKLIATEGSYSYVAIRNVGDVIQSYISYHNYNIPWCFSNAFPFSPALEVEAGFDVVLYCHKNSTFARAFINGWLEDA